MDVFETLKVVDFGDAAIPPEANYVATVENILRAQAAVEAEGQPGARCRRDPDRHRPELAVRLVRDRQADRGTNARATSASSASTPTGTRGRSMPRLRIRASPAPGAGRRSSTNSTRTSPCPTSSRSASAACSRTRRTSGDSSSEGAHFVPMWRVRTEFGIEGLVALLGKAYEGTSDVYVHFDMDVLGGAGPAPGDFWATWPSRSG